MQCDGVVLSVLNPNTVSVLVLILFVIDEDENLFYAGVLTWSKAQTDGVGFPSPNLKLLLFKLKQVWVVCAEIEYPRGRVGVCETDFLIAALPSVYRNVDFKCFGDYRLSACCAQQPGGD